MFPTIYVDNAATTPLCGQALQAMQDCLRDTYGNPASLHTLGQQANAALLRARTSMARHLNCSPRELFFTSGGTESDNMALQSAAAWGREQGKCHILSTAFEHHAVLNTLEALSHQGFEVELLPIGPDHNITARQVQAALRPDTCLVTAMFANNEIGSVLPIAEIGALCRAHGVLFHTDAVQVVGHLPVDVQAQCIDYLSLSAHKFHGPKGIGALYCRKGAPLSPLLLGGGQERGLRPGTQNLPAIVGMAAALDVACGHMEADIAHLTLLQNRLMEGLGAIPGAVLNGSRTHRLPGNVHVSFPDVSGESLLILLDQAGICAGSGAACAAGSLEPSHVLLAIGQSPRLAWGALRLSLSSQNTMEEVDTILEVIPQILARLGQSYPQ